MLWVYLLTSCIVCGMVVFLVRYIIIPHFSRKFIDDIITKSNCDVSGEQGSGKDTFFQYIADHYKHKSNVKYNTMTEIVSYKRLCDSIGQNSYLKQLFVR